MQEFSGEKTEQPTPRRLEEAAKKGQFPRSAEIQTVAVLLGGLLAVVFVGQESWRQLSFAFTATLGNLHNIPLSFDSMQGYGVNGVVVTAKCVGPVLLMTALGGLLAGAVQSRFQTASEVLAADWSRVDPLAGLKRIFSFSNGVPTLLALLKLAVVIALAYSQVVSVLQDPIFFTAVSADRIGSFLAEAAAKIVLRIIGALAVVAALDYGWQFYKTNREMMMTKEEVKDEAKSSEGNPQVRARQRRRPRNSQRNMLLEVAKADVVVTNPTRLAIALRYDRKTMKAPKIVAKGTRLNAQRIREIAARHQVPMIENKPVARMLFKYGRVGSEIPAQLFLAVAEILAWVYRNNRYRYHSEMNQIQPHGSR